MVVALCASFGCCTVCCFCSLGVTQATTDDGTCDYSVDSDSRGCNDSLLQRNGQDSNLLPTSVWFIKAPVLVRVCFGSGPDSNSIGSGLVQRLSGVLFIVVSFFGADGSIQHLAKRLKQWIPKLVRPLMMCLAHSLTSLHQTHFPRLRSLKRSV